MSDIENSHGKPRLIPTRPSDLGSVPTGEDRQRDHAPDGRFASGNRAAAGRAAKRALTAPLRAARTRLRQAVGGQAPSVADELLGDALAVYASAKLELGMSSPLVLGSLVAFATETILAGHFIQRASELGFETESGLQLLQVAHQCETQASRAMTAALAATKALTARRPRRRSSKTAAILAAGEEVK